MKSWRSRIAVGLAVGAAAVTIPLVGAGSAAAAPAPAQGQAQADSVRAQAAGWEHVGGWRSLDDCKYEGKTWVQDPEASATDYMCWPVDAGDSSKGYNLWIKFK